MSGTAMQEPGTLSPRQRAAYRDDGFLFPLRVLSTAAAADYRCRLESMEREFAGAEPPVALPRPLRDYIRVHSEVVMPMAAELALYPAVLDAVESLIGPDIMVWGAEFFIKEPHSPQIVSMHQDLTYWGFGATSNQVTAWIALSPSTVASGCMELVRGSHTSEILPHVDTHAENNILSRGQEVAVEVAEADRTPVELQPGEMSLHHGLAIHGSRPNTSGERRIGFAIRYVNPEAGRHASGREHVMLARGADRDGSFVHHTAPDMLFSARSLETYEEIREYQAKVLGAGMKRGEELFASSAGAEP